MKKLSKKAIIIIVVALLVVAAAVTAIILLTKNTNDEEEMTATVVNISDKYRYIEDTVIEWDSSTKEHTTSGNDVCAVVVGNVTTPFDNFEKAWIYVNTTEKNKDETLFVFYSDWVADENGSFGTGDCFIGGSGGLLIKDWTTKLTIDFNGYKIDRNLTGDSISNGSVIKIDESDNVYFENGCITGGANSDDGAGVLIYGESNVYFDNMTITGNISGNKGGGIYVGSHARLYLNDTTVEGNYSQNRAAVFCDYKDGGGLYKIKKISGVVVIKNNFSPKGYSNLAFGGNIRSNLAACIEKAELSDGSYIGVSIGVDDSVVKPVITYKGNNSKYFDYFHVDSTDYDFRDMYIDSTKCLGIE